MWRTLTDGKKIEEEYETFRGKKFDANAENPMDWLFFRKLKR